MKVLRIVFSTLALLAATPAFADWRADVLTEAKDGTTVKDAVWSAPGSLWIGVLDNGTRRDGFASFVCEVVREHQPANDRTVTVTVWDIAKMTGQDEFVELGRARCT